MVKNVFSPQTFIFFTLLAVYLLVYVPAPRDIDGAAMLAVAASTVRHGSPDMGMIGADDALVPPIGRMGSFGVDGAYYAKKGVTPSLLFSPFVLLADALPHLTTRATVMLFNPLILALTGALLYSLIRQLAYKSMTALLVSLIYGLGTFVLVYSKTLFGEPLAGLLLLIAVLYTQRYCRAPSPDRSALLMLGTALGLAVGINLSYAVMIPIIGVWLLLRGGDKRQLVYALLPLLLIGVLLLAYNWARFGSPLASGYQFGSGEAFDRPPLVGLFGLFLSPFRGLFWYSPVLLLCIPGGLLLWRTKRGIAALILLLVVAQAGVYAAWWSWHGGIVWGPRFLLPVIPLLVVLLAPLIERVSPEDTRQDRKRGLIPALNTNAFLLIVPITLLMFTLLSVFINLLGALYSVDPHIGYLYACCGTGDAGGLISGLRDELLTSIGHSALVGHFALLRGGWTPEPAWLAHGVDWVHLFAAISVLAAGFLTLTIRKFVRFGIAPLIVLIALNVITTRQSGDPTQIRTLQQELQPSGVLLAASTDYGTQLIDLEGGLRPLTMNAPTDPDDPLAQGMWDHALTAAHAAEGWLWYATWFAPADAQNWQERALFETAAFGGERAVIGHRALLFDLSSAAPEAEQVGGWTFGAITLERYGIRRAADRVSVTVEWSAEPAPDAAYSWFIHLLDTTGQIVAQQDRQPQGGYASTQAWTAGTTVTDRLVFPLAEGTDTSGWALRIGWVDPATGERLPVRTETDTAVPDGFIMINLEETK